MNDNTRKVLIIPQQHFDPAWQRHPDEYEEMRENMLLKVMRIMELYPEWTWSFDQKFVLEEFLRKFPQHDEPVRKAIGESRIELVGGQITIPDGNLPGPEAQVRQHLYGKRWMEREFNTTVTVAWYYDTFGMHPQTPQILAKCGFQYMHAIRYCREELEIPFYWEGIDGSELLCHSRDYNHNSWDYQFIDGALDRIKNLKNQTKFMVDQFIPVEDYPGYFDQPNLSSTLWYEPHSEEQMPSCRVAVNARRWNKEQKAFNFRFAIPREYYEELLQSGEKIKTYQGDMNPEFTGCYASRHWHKLRNRKAENDLTTAETIGWLASLKGFKPDTAAIRQAWEELGIVDHHDGITGCHVDSVDAVVAPRLDIALKTAADETERAMRSICAGKDPAVTVFNPLPWPRRDVIKITDATGLIDEDGNDLPSRAEEFERDLRVEVLTPPVPGLGFRTFTKSHQTVAPADSFGGVFESNYYNVVAGEKGIESICLKSTGGEVTRPGRLFGEIWLEEDQGNLYFEKLTENRIAASADPQPIARETGRDALSMNVTYSGRIAAPWRHGSLRWRQRFIFWNHTPLVEVRVSLDWKGQDARVTMRFPTASRDNSAIYEIPFGAVERAAYKERCYAKDNMWPAQNWTALNWNDLTFALYNQGMGGVAIKDGELWTALMRSIAYKGGWGTDMIGHPCGPGALAEGNHEFRLFFEFREGDWRDLDLSRAGREINCGLVAKEGAVNKAFSMIADEGIEITPGSIVATALKCAEDEPRSAVLRLYESAGRETKCRIEFPESWGLVSSSECNLMEEPESVAAPIRNSQLSLSFKPFEIKTILLRRI